MKLKDWQIRAIKTFIQAFGGVFVPEIVLILNGNMPKDLNAAKIILIPVICSALAAGISAVWNVILEHLEKEPNLPFKDQEE